MENEILKKLIIERILVTQLDINDENCLIIYHYCIIIGQSFSEKVLEHGA